MSAFGAFSQSMVVSTLYTNLGDEAIMHGLNETGVSLVVTSHELLPKFKRILASTPTVKNIVYMENPIKTTSTEGRIYPLVLLLFITCVKATRRE